jgi:hypothetical protein
MVVVVRRSSGGVVGDLMAVDVVISERTNTIFFFNFFFNSFISNQNYSDSIS